jgi:hypothetical protein
LFRLRGLPRASFARLVTLLPQRQEDLARHVAHAFHVGVGVLNDEAGNLARPFGKNSETDRAAEILHVQNVGVQTQMIDQAFYGSRQSLEVDFQYGSGQPVYQRGIHCLVAGEPDTHQHGW